jgi:hypothetical protein
MHTVHWNLSFKSLTSNINETVHNLPWKTSAYTYKTDLKNPSWCRTYVPKGSHKNLSLGTSSLRLHSVFLYRALHSSHYAFHYPGAFGLTILCSFLVSSWPGYPYALGTNRLLVTKFLLYEIWGSQSGVDEDSSLVGCYAEWLRDSFVTFQRAVSPPTSMILSPWRTGLITLEDEGDKILQNAGNHLPSDTAQVPGDRKRHQIFTTALSISFKSKFSYVLPSQMLPWSTQINSHEILKDNFEQTCSVYKG